MFLCINHKKICVLFVLLILLPITYAKSQNNNPPQAKIKVIPVESSSDAFTLTFVIHNNLKRENWGIGFFMFHVFLKTQNSLNIEICENNTMRCEKLKVDKKSQNMPLSVGHITLLSPLKSFMLYPKESYTIIVNGLLNPPRNITAMPQQPFFYNFHTQKVAYIKVTEYGDIKSYKTYSNQQTRESAIITNWNSSKPVNLTSFVLPTPVSVVYESGINNGNNMILVSYCNSLYNDESQITYCNSIKNNPEGYVLKIESNNILVSANTTAGVFYSQQTLLQLRYYYNDDIPNQTIIDYPRFKYRGVMLDTVRHFFKVSEIKQLIDLMAASKLNTLHLHLADDEGFRVQIPGYERLSSVGGVRSLHSKIPPSNLVDEDFDITNTLHKKYEQVDSIYKGVYTVKQLKNLIAYANQRQITIIPEIEMPGHALALKLAMPEIFADVNDKSKYWSVQGYNDNVLPICKYGVDSTFTNSVDTLIKGVADIFSNQTTLYAVNHEVSLSGDEVPNGAYSDFSYCESPPWLGLDNEDISHKYFKDISENLSSYKVSGWQQLVQRDTGEIRESESVLPGRIGHIWAWEPTNSAPVSGYVMANNLLNKNYPVVLDFADLTYFDMRYTDQFIEPGLYWANNYAGTFEALSIGWKIDNMINQVATKQLKNLQGIEGAIWSELIPTKEHLFYMALPKMLGLAEAGWAKRESLNWRNLATKLGCGERGFLTYLYQTNGVNYRGYPKGIIKEIPSNVCNRAVP